jgi:hypothetical protein
MTRNESGMGRTSQACNRVALSALPSTSEFRGGESPSLLFDRPQNFALQLNVYDGR